MPESIVKKYFVDAANSLVGGAIGYLLTYVADISAQWKLPVVLGAAAVGTFANWFADRKSRKETLIESPKKRSITADSPRTAIGPIQVFLPDRDRKSEGDFYQDGATQWDGFRQAQKEARGMHDALDVEYQSMLIESGRNEVLRKMQELYTEKGSRFFVMTMSSKLEEIRDGFKAWHTQCTVEGMSAPILVATVASAPGLADAGKGMVRWYVRSEEESHLLADYLDKLGVNCAGAFCITDTPGVADNAYGTEGLKHFRTWFAGNVREDLQFHVTARNARAQVQQFFSKCEPGECPGVFVIGYGDMIKNTVTELIAGGYQGCIVCTSTLTDPQWQPEEPWDPRTLRIVTVRPRLANTNERLEGLNRNVVFFFARKTLLRVLNLTAKSTDAKTFLRNWKDRQGEDPHALNQEYLANGDILVHLRTVEADEWR
jgi:hypothetical protein